MKGIKNELLLSLAPSENGSKLDKSFEGKTFKFIKLVPARGADLTDNENDKNKYSRVLLSNDGEAISFNLSQFLGLTTKVKSGNKAAKASTMIQAVSDIDDFSIKIKTINDSLDNSNQKVFSITDYVEFHEKLSAWYQIPENEGKARSLFFDAHPNISSNKSSWTLSSNAKPFKKLEVEFKAL